MAIESAGGTCAPLDSKAEARVVDFRSPPRGFARALRRQPGIRRVQLPSAGIEAFADSISEFPALTWTSAKGAYARPVAEHALALTLALLRDRPLRARSTSWGTSSGTSLHGLRVLVIGAGGIGVEILRLLKCFDTTVTVMRRREETIPGADRTITGASLHDELLAPEVVIVAAALTGATRRLLGVAELALLPGHAIIVNIARGGMIDTEALTKSLREGMLAGAALDVTDPDPLPDGHPLWAQPRALITPHSADTMEMIIPLLAARVPENVLRMRAGDPLTGFTDIEAGY
ncbi:NAD(P)-dependent oxidoreductase [Paeniglutamicibacter cryotolerans]|uniref:Phosphoglycerate dehydrogenase-like enzyme n=1 Tax=Paeniglutamicibacter cryotolerans TaxID=670079 RepID=A0A839QL80_9MICC|nr:NAD(P)-dependent oxidoreductase [Paeniglutamicibacter cryotolerans]MBB2995524.1 phosphoglycerate dehydrogenase-like enzyme [Paeniglutamicibacter cryotolerans]